MPSIGQCLLSQPLIRISTDHSLNVEIIASVKMHGVPEMSIEFTILDLRRIIRTQVAIIGYINLENY